MSGNNHNNKSLGSGEWAAAGGGGGGANTNTTPRKSTAYNANRRRSTARKSKAAHRKESVLRSSVLSGGLAGAGTSSASNVLVDWVTRRTRIFKRAKPEDPDEAARGYVTQAQEAPKKVSFMALFTYATCTEKWLMIAGLASALIAGLAMPVWLLLLAQSLETFNNIGKIISQGGDISILSDQLYQLIYSFAILGAVSLFSGAIYVALWTYTGERQSLRIREKFVRGTFKQEAAWLDKRGDPQELPTLATNALMRINDSIGRIIADTFSNLLSAVGCLAVAIGLDPPLALIMLCMLPVIAIAIAIVSHFMRKKSGLALDQFSSAGAFATEVIGGIKTVASLGCEKWAVEKYDSTAGAAQTYSVASGFLSKLASGIMGFLFYGTYTFAFIFGTQQVYNTTATEEEKINPFACMFEYCGISGSEVMVCIYGVILCAQFFALMSPGIQAINFGRTAAADVFDAISREPAIDGSSDEGIKIGNYDGSIELQNVIFAYPSRPQSIIFNNFNLKIGAGQSVALVGPSGSGKSTISRLLLRLYDPIAGQLVAGGVSLKDLNLKWWRSQIGYVPQEPSLFPGTVRSNIAVGKNESDGPASDEEIIEAAKAACAHEFIMELPESYDTFYSGSSIQLSGGQIQRIAIARAIIRNPTVLLLDEATSALDTESEKVVQDALAGIRKTRKLTTVTVAHRLMTIVDSDKIAVIAEGSIQEMGTHRELMKEDGIYAGLCQMQGITADAADEAAGSGATNSSVSPQDGNAKEEKAVVETAGNTDDIEVGLKSDDKPPDAHSGDDMEVIGEEAEEEPASFWRLWKYNKPEGPYISLGLVSGLVIGALPPLEGILFGKLTANFFTLGSEEMKAQNLPLSLGFLGLAGASLLGNMGMGCGFSVSGFRLTRRLRVLVFEKIVRHSMGWFDFPENSTGELTEHLEEDAENVANVTGWQLGSMVSVVASLFTGLLVALIFSWQIGLISVACVPFIVGAGMLQASCTKPKVVTQEGTVSAPTILERGLHDIALVKAYNMQDKVADDYSAALKPDAAYKKKQGVLSGLAYGFSQFATFSTFALLFYAGIMLMANQKVSFEAFFISLLAVMFAAFAAGQSNVDFSARKTGLIAAARIFGLLDEPIDEDDPYSSLGTIPDSLDGTINFESCVFAYPSRPNVDIYYPSEGRDGFSLSIPAKETVAFTGRSGCGKSTALQLVLRFYRVDSGEVKLDTNNVDDVNLNWLRGKIGYVGQMPVLFQLSVRDNILLGKPNATQEEVEKAAEAANAHEFITGLSDGYDTNIGAGGSLLSGGQKQRLAIARAIIKDPQILVLDEATSALDNESEKVVQAALDRMQQKNPRTTLTVAHRLETIKNCDKIAVLNRGGVAEYGTHTALLAEKGIYYSLWERQGLKED